MPERLTIDDARQSLAAHAAERGAEIRQKYGPHPGWKELTRLLEDRACVRYPCRIVFDASPLQPGEFAHPEPEGEKPEDGFTMFVHPLFMGNLDEVPPLVLYQLVLVNYGLFASATDAEVFGSEAYGLPREEYYNLICNLADKIHNADSRC